MAGCTINYNFSVNITTIGWQLLSLQSVPVATECPVEAMRNVIQPSLFSYPGLCCEMDLGAACGYGLNCTQVEEKLT